MDFDGVVVGGGPAGEVVAARCADGGLRVALVEEELVGGECSYWGCVPSKTLIRPGDVLAAAARVTGVAESLDKSIDIASALARRDYMTGNWSDVGQETWLAEHGITLVRGVGRLQGPATVVVTDHDGGEHVLAAERAVVIATGTTAALPPIDGLADARPWTNREITAAKEVPRRLVVLGGGAIGLEMAQAFRRLGSEEVTVIEAFPQLLGREEPFAGEEVGAALQAEGITIVTGSAAKRVRRDGTDGPVTVELAGASYVGDELLVADGRQPATNDLGLDTVGLAPGKPITVD